MNSPRLSYSLLDRKGRYRMLKLVVFCAFILVWLGISIADESNPYRQLEKLDPEGRFVLEWEVNWELEQVFFNVTVETKGWIGFGLSAKESLEGADVVVGGFGRDGQPYILDLHGVNSTNTEVDQNQDWKLHSSWRNVSHISLNFSRKIETCDDDDYSIGDFDLTTLIWTVGQTDEYDHVWNHCETCHGSFPVYLLDKYMTPRGIQEARINNQEPGPEQLGDLKLWTITRRQRVPKKETTYWCSFTKGPKLKQKHHIVGFQYRWESPGEYHHTHHLVLFRCTAPFDTDPVSFFEPFVRNSTGEECYFLGNHNGQLPVQHCKEVKHGSAIGQRMFFLPNETGIPFGESPDEYYLLQLHYNNPELLSDLEYEVKIDLYYTEKLRQFDGGVMSIGHAVPGIPSIFIPRDTPDHSIYGHCGSDCTNQMFPEDGINLVAVALHTHNAGQRIQVKHFRGDEELPWISNDDNFQNDFQAARLLRQAVKILPGDHVISRCVFDTTSANGSIIGGFSIRHEMCLMYMWYYTTEKLQDVAYCRSSIQSEDYVKNYFGVYNLTWDQSQIEYVVTEPSSMAGLSLTQVADRYLHWTPEKRQQLQADHTSFPQQNECSGKPFSGGVKSETVPRGSYSVKNPDGAKGYVPSSRREKCIKFQA